MLSFIFRRFLITLLSILVLTFVVFQLVNLRPNLVTLAKQENNVRMTDAQVESWLEKEGFNRNIFVRYSEWLGGVLTGDFGFSTRFKTSVNSKIGDALVKTGILMFWVLLVMVPTALVLGILAGMREGSGGDRTISVFSTGTSALPEYVSGPVLAAISFAFLAGYFKSVVGVRGIDFQNFTLPVLTMAIYGTGYIARMTRASMAEVMTSQYVRTARLKGLTFGAVVVKHAVRNALITPFTIIMLQFPWLLTGVVIVEKLFNYKGFGFVLLEGALNNDIYLTLAASIVSVVVVLLTQLISDIGYVFLNPRIRVR